MDWLAVNPRLWNLSALTVCAAAVGCGPPVVSAEDSGDDGTGSTSVGDDSNDAPAADSNTTGADEGGDSGGSTSDGPPPQCEVDVDCDSFQVCEDGVCVDDDDYCYDPYDYYTNDGCGDKLCAEHTDCAFEQICEIGRGDDVCGELDRLPECDEADVPSLALLPDQPMGVGPIHSLAFVDANADAATDLVVSRPNYMRLHFGADPDGAIDLPVPDGVLANAVVAADFNGDGSPDLVAALGEDELAMLLADQAGGFVPAPTPVLERSGTRQLFAVAFDDNETIDLIVVRGDQLEVLLGDDAGAFPETVVLSNAVGGPIAVSEVDGAPSIVGTVDAALVEWRGGDDADTFVDETWFGDQGPVEWRPLVAGTGDARDVSAAGPIHGRYPEWTLLASDALEAPGLAAIPHDTTLTATGDIDGDGTDDLLLSDGDRITFVRRAPGGGLSCASEIQPANTEVEHLAVGDFNGDGRDDIATAQGSLVQVWSAE